MSGQPTQRRIHLRTSSDKKKALAQYDELRRSGRLARAVVIAKLKDDSYQVLGQGMDPDTAANAPRFGEIAEALVAGAQALKHVALKRQELRPEPHEQPERVGKRTGYAQPVKEITTDAEGVMVPPAGENFTSCGECSHPRWYILGSSADDLPARFACAHCGNEVKLHRIRHQTGHA